MTHGVLLCVTLAGGDHGTVTQASNRPRPSIPRNLGTSRQATAEANDLRLPFQNTLDYFHTENLTVFPGEFDLARV